MKRAREGNPRIAVAYLRVSTDEQRLGPEAQRATIEAWAAREGIAVAAWHLDEGVSGGADIAQRQGLVHALGELRALGAGVLIVAKRDRLARETTIAGLIERAARQCGARVVSADGVANGDTPEAGFMRAILDAAAQYERALIAARTRAALAVKRARRERIGAVPLGYRVAADGTSMEPDEREQVIIAAARELRDSSWSLGDIADELTARELLPRSGKRWHRTQIARMLRASAA